MRRLLAAFIMLTGCSATLEQNTVVPINPKLQELLIFFEDDNDVIVRECPNYYNITKRSECIGIETRVNKEHFYKSLAEIVTIKETDYYKVYSQEEFATLEKDWKLKAQYDEEREKEFRSRFNQIKTFITLFQPEFDSDADVRLLEQTLGRAEKDLRSGKRESAAINGINLYNRALLKKIGVSNTFFPHGFSHSMYQFFLPVLKQFDPAYKTTCGLLGDLETRKKDCWRLRLGNDGTPWNLVSRYADGSTLWLPPDQKQVPQPILHKHPTEKDVFVLRYCPDILEITGPEFCTGQVLAIIPFSSIKKTWFDAIGLSSWDFVIPYRANEKIAYEISDHLQAQRKKYRQQFNEIKVDRLREFIKIFQGYRDLKLSINEAEVALRFAVADLNNGRERSKNVAKVNDFVTQAINQTLKDYQIYPYSFSQKPNDFVSAIIRELSPSSRPACGLTGDIPRRIKTCSHKKIVDAHEWGLVTRTEGGSEVWRDPVTQYLWAAQTTKKMGHIQALEYCMSKDSLEERGYLNQLHWELPSLTDYRAADIHGIGTLFPELNDVWNWTSTFRMTDKAISIRFYQKDSRPNMTYEGLTSLNLRCVSKP